MTQIKVAEALQNGLEASPEKETLHPHSVIILKLRNVNSTHKWEYKITYIKQCDINMSLLSFYVIPPMSGYFYWQIISELPELKLI